MSAISGVCFSDLDQDLFEDINRAVGDCNVLYEGIFDNRLMFRPLDPGEQRLDSLNSLIMKRLMQHANPAIEAAIAQTEGLTLNIGAV